MFRRPKFGNKKTEIDGIVFDSKKEASRYNELKMLLKLRAIRDLELQPEYPLEVNGKKVCKYRADFRYVDLSNGKTIVEDAKGFKTPEYRLKKKLMLAIHGIEIQEV